jgi:aminoglycoside phosphotransferase (APT) family kinase protein
MSDKFTGLGEVPARLRFDTHRLEEYLAERIDGFAGPLQVTQFKGGQSNPTFLLSTPSAEYVLRQKPRGTLLPSAHAIDREFRVQKALAGTDVPVAPVRCYCSDTTLIGAEFYVMDRVEGRVIWDPSLPGLDAASRSAIYDEMNRVMAALHSLDLTTVGLFDFGRHGGFFARQILRWTQQYRASQTEHIAAMEHLIEWLPTAIPCDAEPSLVHGDFRIDNLIFHPHEARIVAVLDWELSTIGHPMADFAYHCMAWEVEGDRGLAQHDLVRLGIPTSHAYLAAYCDRRGIPRPTASEWDFYLAYNLFRAAGICQGILHRAANGSASSAHALDIGSRARALAELSWRRAAPWAKRA